MWLVFSFLNEVEKNNKKETIVTLRIKFILKKAIISF